MNTNNNTEGSSGDIDVCLRGGTLIMFCGPSHLMHLLTYRGLVSCCCLAGFGVFAVVIFSL